jgi:hypothetical protein
MNPQAPARSGDSGSLSLSTYPVNKAADGGRWAERLAARLPTAVADDGGGTPGFKGKSQCKNTCAPGSSYTHAYMT